MDSTIIISLPRVHVAGSNALHEAHVEIGAHGVALFLTPDAPLPFLDIDCTRAILRELVELLAASLHEPETPAEMIRKAAWEFSS